MEELAAAKDIRSDDERLTPMMRHYLETKEAHPDCILFYRLGDFYEMFFADALTVSKELELTLTGKACGLDKRAPMCGVPHHASESYLTKLVSRGYKVAVCEQMEDPKTAKGMVKRDVVRIVTPGTNLNMLSLDESKNNYICSVFYAPDISGIAVADVTTGTFRLTECNSLRALTDEISKFSPSELICNEAFQISGADMEDLKERQGIAVYTLPSRYFDTEGCRRELLSHFNVASLTGLGLEDFPCGSLSAGALVKYLSELHKDGLPTLTSIDPYVTGSYMLLDSATRRNLELTETLRDKRRQGSLIWVLDKTKTAMGARLLRLFLEQPLIDRDEIVYRQGAVQTLFDNVICRDEIREYLSAVYDLERLLARVTYKSANPRDLLALKGSLEALAPIKAALEDVSSDKALADIDDMLDPLTDLKDLINSAIMEDAPLAVREGGIIRPDFDDEVDRLREADVSGKQWLADLEASEREETGIKNLKIKYTGNFGYLIEVTNAYKGQVPEHFIRRQTLTNCERYTTEKLKDLEDTILNARERLYAREYALFCEIRDAVSFERERILTSARAVALLDVFISLAHVAEKRKYVRPEVNDSGVLNIKGGRHPVVEAMLKNEAFIENNTKLDDKKHALAIITGPNMAGKSTYLRQTALITLMAQTGSFVPAKSAEIGIADRIFTRVGASDDLSSGQSTFMVEMNEVANILRNATKRSLLILDEIGRGTSTYDGLSIAWAVIEHIANRRILGARTLFATHYHELTELEGKIDNVNNYCIAVQEKGDGIVFLRKIIKGGADKSYGIQVARLAGVPHLVTDRAEEIAGILSDNDITDKIEQISVDLDSAPVKVKHYDEVDLGQMTLFETNGDEEVLRKLKEIDVTRLTPMDALNTLYMLQNELKNRY